MVPLLQFMVRFGVLAAVWAVSVSWARAQNPNLPATYGEVKLKAGFLPDPHTKQLSAGGPIKTNLGGVKSHVANAPDYRLYYTAGTGPLTFKVLAAKDTTLLINLPNGQWIADDDAGKGLNPTIHLPNPKSGRYDIYVGTYKPGNAQAKLFISDKGGPKPPVVTPNPNLPPTHGEFTVRAGLLPDLRIKEVFAGGPIKTHLGGVWAHVSQAPDYRLHYTPGQVPFLNGNFPLTFAAVAEKDTTLLIRLPDGTWRASDDSQWGRNPMIHLANPQFGRYDIFVGTFGPQATKARLVVSEFGPN